ncbi:MAG TPA: 30S ribosome-binding factor RbfA [Thermoanaerobaculia bacterium]|nr:30S ribosome-binding factor RbfA [Thermoanaerobaculia bacterium]
MSRRTDRVEDLLRHELADLLLREVSDPRVRLASISAVRVSANLDRARVLVSVLGEEPAQEECLVALQHARGYLRRHLARRLRMKTTPELEFALDRGAEHSVRIAQLLESLHHDDDEAT